MDIARMAQNAAAARDRAAFWQRVGVNLLAAQVEDSIRRGLAQAARGEVRRRDDLIEEADPATGTRIAYDELTKAAVELDSEHPDLGHVSAHISAALIWLGHGH